MACRVCCLPTNLSVRVEEVLKKRRVDSGAPSIFSRAEQQQQRRERRRSIRASQPVFASTLNGISTPAAEPWPILVDASQKKCSSTYIHVFRCYFLHAVSVSASAFEV